MNGALAGTHNGRAKLTWEKVDLIRETYNLFKGGFAPRPFPRLNNRVTSIQKLAKRFHVGRATLWDLLQNRTWKNH